MLKVLALLTFGYLLGSVPSGWLVMKVYRNQDVRKLGSGNIGAANVYRAGGLGAFTFTLIADGLKGFIPVLTGIVLGLVDGTLDSGIQKALNRRIKRVQGHQNLNFLVLYSNASRLKGIQNGALAARQVQPRSSSFADGLENTLHQLELVWREGIVLHEVHPVAIWPEGHAAVREGELVLENIAFHLENVL